MEKRYLIQEIKSRVKMPDVLRKYGYEPKRGNRIPCPLHRGKDANFGFKDDFFKCFVCGESGDVITFVQKLFSLSFSDAITLLNRDFMLGLPIGEKTTLRKRRDVEERAKAEEEQRKREKEEKEKLCRELDAAFAEWKRLDEQFRENRPKTPNEDPNELFIEAVLNLSAAEFSLQEAETRIYLHEHRRKDHNNDASV